MWNVAMQRYVCGTMSFQYHKILPRPQLIGFKLPLLEVMILKFPSEKWVQGKKGS